MATVAGPARVLQEAGPQRFLRVLQWILGLPQVFLRSALPVANALHLLYLEDEEDEQVSEKAYALRLNKSDYSALRGALALAETRNVAQQAQGKKDLLEKEADIDSKDLSELDEAN